jgi:uncharacterized membrane protein YfcA
MDTTILIAFIIGALIGAPLGWMLGGWILNRIFPD